jgi:hypothetical protein
MLKTISLKTWRVGAANVTLNDVHYCCPNHLNKCQMKLLFAEWEEFILHLSGICSYAL